MPAFGRDFDSRFESTSGSARSVSPIETGAGKLMSLKPRLPTVVPLETSLTPTPTTSPSVKMLLTSRVPDTECSLANSDREHTSELQSLMRISYAVFCLKKKNKRYESDR